jgi:hypothetical protein
MMGDPNKRIVDTNSDAKNWMEAMGRQVEQQCRGRYVLNLQGPAGHIAAVGAIIEYVEVLEERIRVLEHHLKIVSNGTAYYE